MRRVGHAALRQSTDLAKTDDTTVRGLVIIGLVRLRAAAPRQYEEYFRSVRDDLELWRLRTQLLDALPAEYASLIVRDPESLESRLRERFLGAVRAAVSAEPDLLRLADSAAA